MDDEDEGPPPLDNVDSSEEEDDYNRLMGGNRGNLYPLGAGVTVEEEDLSPGTYRGNRLPYWPYESSRLRSFQGAIEYDNLQPDAPYNLTNVESIVTGVEERALRNYASFTRQRMNAGGLWGPGRSRPKKLRLRKRVT